MSPSRARPSRRIGATLVVPCIALLLGSAACVGPKAAAPRKETVSAPSAELLPVVAVPAIADPEGVLSADVRAPLDGVLSDAVRALIGDPLQRAVPAEWLAHACDDAPLPASVSGPPHMMISGCLSRAEGGIAITLRARKTGSSWAPEARVIRSTTGLTLRTALEQAAVAPLRSWMQVLVRRDDEAGWLRRLPAEVALGDEALVVASFETEPPGARVLLDGRELCAHAPCRRAVAVGRRRVAAELAAHASASREVELSQASRRVLLKLAPTGGLLSVETEPPGLPVFVDGQRVGAAPVQALPVSAAMHDVLAGDGCFLEAGERLSIGAGERRTVRVAPAQRMAGLRLRARDDEGNDLEARVWIDGVERGTTPLAMRVPLCASSLEVWASGGRVWRQSLELKEGQVAELTVQPRGCPEGMAFVAGGPLAMGSEEWSDARPVHAVAVASFCIDRTEAAGSGGLPEVHVSWREASEACRVRGGRLPTEAEWEWAARGLPGRRYPWGDASPTSERARYCASGEEAECRRLLSPWPVGSSREGATVEGIYDLAGNVWEWTSDAFASYDGTGASAHERVIRGGSFATSAAQLPAALRSKAVASQRYPDVGYRCVIEPGASDKTER